MYIEHIFHLDFLERRLRRRSARAIDQCQMERRNGSTVASFTSRRSVRNVRITRISLDPRAENKKNKLNHSPVVNVANGAIELTNTLRCIQLTRYNISVVCMRSGQISQNVSPHSIYIKRFICCLTIKTDAEYNY